MLRALVDAPDNWLNLKRLELTVNVDNETSTQVYKTVGVRGADTFRGGKYVDSFFMARLNPGWRMTMRCPRRSAPCRGSEISGT